MATTLVSDVMTREVVFLPGETTLDEAAQVMRDRSIGDVVVTHGPTMAGMVTDRDIVVRAIADGRDPQSTTVREASSGDLVTLTPDQDLDDAIRLMREHDVRRLPVVQDGRPIGILALGDLAVERDSDSALADISAASPNE